MKDICVLILDVLLYDAYTNVSISDICGCFFLQIEL